MERPSDESCFVEGVAYAILPTEKEKLDEIERGGYTSQPVGIKLNGRHEEAYTHVPLSMSSCPDGQPTREYLDIIIDRASEHRLSESVSVFRAIREKLD